MQDEIKQPLIWVSILAFCSGFVLLIPSQILITWLLDTGCSIEHVGWVSLLLIPSMFSFLWAPWVDYIAQKQKNHRRYFLSVNFICLAAGIWGLSISDPKTSYSMVLLCALGIVFISATQDHLIEAYRLFVLPKDHYATGVSLSLLAFRVGVMLSGGVGLIFAANYGWSTAFRLSSVIMLGMAILMLMAPNGRVEPVAFSLREHISLSKKYFLQTIQDYRFIAVLLTHRLSIFWIEAMLPAFLMRHLGMGVEDVGVLYKVFGVVGLLIGGGVLARLVKQYSLVVLIQWLLFFQVLICGGFYGLTVNALNAFSAVAILVLAECMLQGGIGAVSGVWLMMRADKSIPAFCFSLWYGLAAFGRVVVGPIAAWVIDGYGWGGFMAAGVVMSIVSWRICVYQFAATYSVQEAT